MHGGGGVGAAALAHRSSVVDMKPSSMPPHTPAWTGGTLRSPPCVDRVGRGGDHAKMITPAPRSCPSVTSPVLGFWDERITVPCQFTGIFGDYQDLGLQAASGQFRVVVLIFSVVISGFAVVKI